MSSNEDEGSFRDEFRLKNFGLGCDRPYLFSLPAWNWPNGAFLAWRVFWALWHVAWIIRSIQDQVSEEEYGSKWLIYLTNWQYAIILIQSVLHLIIVIRSRCKSRTSPDDFEEESTNGLEKSMWLFTEIAYDTSIIVTIMYWGFVFTELTDALNIITHAVTTFYIICDIFISATPTRLLHFIYGSLFGTIYGVFTLVFFAADGRNNENKDYIYTILDWNGPGMAAGIIVGLVLVVTPLVHLFIFGLYTFRLYLSRQCGCGRREDKSGPVV